MRKPFSLLAMFVAVFTPAAIQSSVAFSQEDGPVVIRRVIQLTERAKPKIAIQIAEEVAQDAPAIEVRAPGTHWIGLACGELNETVKVQLHLDHGLTIDQVLPDSPAEKAGLKQHDIVTQFGDTKLNDIMDLVKAVNDAKDDESTLTYLRGGKKKTIKITPATRPDSHAAIAHPKPARAPTAQEALHLWLNGLAKPHAADDPQRLMLIGPGILEQFRHGRGKLPAGVSIRVEKEGDKPASIIIKKDGKEWKTTDDKLDQLPAEIRKLYGQMHGGEAMDLRIFGNEDQLRNAGAVPPARPHIAPPAPQLKLWTPSGTPSNIDKQFEELRKEMEKMREEIKKLQKN